MPRAVHSDPPTERPGPERAEAERIEAEGTPTDVPPEDTDRPTVIPPFDVESYAKESASSVRVPGTATAPPGGGVPSTAPTVMPPNDLPPELRGAFGSVRAPQATLTNEAELEDARVRSSRSDSGPPRTMSSRMNALSLADARLPTPPNMAAVSSHSDAPVQIHETSPPPTAPPGSLRPDLLDDGAKTDVPPAPPDPVQDMKDRFQLGDYSGALVQAEGILTTQPQHAEASKIAEECQRVLIKMYAARIGPLDRVPMVMVQQHELRWLSIDHRAGFLLSLVDGLSSIEMILDVSGMPLLDTLRILHELYQQKIISFRT